MALTREKKAELLAKYETDLAKAPHAFVLGFQGVKVPQVTDLRQKVRDSGGTYLVVKNTLALRAVDGKALAALSEDFTGATAIAFTDGDVVALAKVLTQFAKDVPAVQFKRAIVDGKAVAASQVKDIANLPSREELVSRLLFLLQSPISRLVRGLAAITRELVVVVDQIAKQREGGSN